MILYFNARTIKSGSGGVQKWAREVLGAISELSKSQDFNFELVEISPKLPIFLNGPLAYIWEQLFLPLRIKNNGVLLSPGNVGPILVRDQCIVVHDLLPLMFPIHYSKKYVFAIKLIYRLLLKRVSHIVTVSDQQKSLIEELYNISSNKITNAGAGVQVTKLHQIDMNNEKNEVNNYYLFVGGSVGRKNLDFIKAFWNDIYSETKVELWIVGRKSASNSYVEHSPKDESLGMRWIYEPSEEEMSQLYENMIALLHPSLAEGFGMPLLESMAYGKYFISSPVGAAKELRTGKSKILELDTRLWKQEIISSERTSSFDINQVIAANEHSWLNVAEKILKQLTMLYF